VDVIAVDSSILIAALQEWHAAHESAAAVMRRGQIRLPVHVLAETYSTLTGGRVKPRTHPRTAAAALQRLPGPPLALSAAGYLATMRRVAEQGLVGGAVYDALVAVTALEAGATLVSRDRRAATTYAVIGVSCELVA
jgi:predicted nucleic acid-binding protein